ncbi:MAG: lipopolysaccharide biosynthesis protein RfbH [Candidatus Omnitrophota bacterium]|nr:lipopolysaccharide biosynthesis protein RfbH [Candidatus Omnitrophota bacterium]
MERKIRNKIHTYIKDLYSLRVSKEKFICGKTRINYAGRVYDEKEIFNLVDASLDFWLTAGRYAGEFEEKMAKFLGVKSCLLTNSGSSANLLAISALTSPLLKDRQLQAGDEVVTTACGFPTTLNPILQNKLVPVFIDVEMGTYNIRAELIEKAITKETKAIFISHTLGNPVDIDLILRIAKKHKLWFIEDNCDALGSKYKGQYTGTFGDISTCSFYPPHHITMGEGGAVLTDNPLLRRIIMSFRDWGRDCWCESGHDNTCKKRFSQKFGDLPYGYDHKYIYSHIGYNLRVTDMQAAVGCAQLEKLPGFIKARKKNFAFFMKHFRKYDKYLILPEAAVGSGPSWFGFPILVKEGAPFTRNDIVNYLEANKIATRMLFGGNLTKQPAYKNAKYRIFGDLKNTDLVMNNLFWIGVYPGLNHLMLGYMKDTFKGFFSKI